MPCRNYGLRPGLPLFSQNFSMFPREYVDDLWSMKSEDVGLIACAVIFQDFQPMWSWSTSITDKQTDRETDGQTTCNHKTALYTIVHHAVKMDHWIWMAFGLEWGRSRDECIRWGVDCQKGRGSFGSKCGASHCNQLGLCGIVVQNCMNQLRCHLGWWVGSTKEWVY